MLVPVPAPVLIALHATRPYSASWIAARTSTAAYRVAQPKGKSSVPPPSPLPWQTARPQLENLAGGVEVVVATPGRLVDFLERDLVSLRSCRFLVLDEADRRAARFGGREV